MQPSPVSRYRVTWRRIGETETFIHEVMAASVRKAVTESRKHVRAALGPNISLWQPEAIENLLEPRQ